MVAQKQTLLAALPPDDPLSAASQMQSQATLDKQVGWGSGNRRGCPPVPNLRSKGSSRRHADVGCMAQLGARCQVRAALNPTALCRCC